jgi:hypothetical protein
MSSLKEADLIDVIDAEKIEGVEIVGGSIEDLGEEDEVRAEEEQKQQDEKENLRAPIAIITEEKRPSSSTVDPLAKTLVFQTNMDDSKMLDSISGEILAAEEELIEKKRQSFNFLKQWNAKGQFLMSIQKNLSDRITEKLFRFGENSVETQKIIIRFFMDRVAQEEKYSVNKLISLKDAYRRQDSEGLEYDSLNEGMKLIYDLHNTNNMGAVSNANAIEQFLKRNLSETNREYANRLTHFRDNINSLRKQLKSSVIEMNERFLEYCKEFSECNK